MRPPSPQYCSYCNRGFPSVNQYRYCDACGQPTMSVGAGLQPPVIAQGPGASGKSGLNSLVILAVGLALIVAIGLVIFFVLNGQNEDAAPDLGPSQTSQPINAPRARIVGSVVGTVETPAKVDYLVVEIVNPVSGTPLSITGEELTILYQDSQNRERISYPRAEDDPGLITNEDDKESIDACSDLAKQPNYKAVWCYVTDGNSRVLAPGASGDIYIFIGGLPVPLGEGSRFQIDFMSSDWQQTLMGQTPDYLEPLSQTATPGPTVLATPSVATQPVAAQPAPTTQPDLRFPEPVEPPDPPPTQPPDPPSTQLPDPPPTQPVVTPAPALAQLPQIKTMVIPHFFMGRATKGGEFAPVGTRITVWIAGYSSPVGETVTFVPTAPGSRGKNYQVYVNQYGAVLSEGSSLMFHIGKQDTDQVYPWSSGLTTILNLAVQ